MNSKATEGLRPCDCPDEYTAKQLNEQGIGINENSISVQPNSVALTMGHTAIKISMRLFKTFAEWYLKPQMNTEDSLQSPDELNEDSINRLGEEYSVIKTPQDIIDEFNFEPQELNSLAFPEYSEEEAKILMERYAAQFKSINQQKEIPDKFYPGYQYQELFSYMSKEYSLTLLQSEMDEIIGIAKRFNAGNNTGESEGVEEGLIDNETIEDLINTYLTADWRYYNTERLPYLFGKELFISALMKQIIEPLQKRLEELKEMEQATYRLMISGEQRGHNKAKEHYEQQITDLKKQVEELQNTIMNQERKIIELEKTL